jgi:hypothetical protein
MGPGAVELVVEGPLLVQHAIENIRRDPPRREARHFGWQCESLRRHGAETSREKEKGRRFDAISALMSKGQQL